LTLGLTAIEQELTISLRGYLVDSSDPNP